MASLHRHLTDPGHDRLAFRADCPRCRTRLHGRLDPRLLSPRGEAAAAAGLAAATTLLSSAAALADSQHPSPDARAPQTPPAVVVDPPGARAHVDAPTPQPRDDAPPPGPARTAPSPPADGTPPAELEPTPTDEPSAPARTEPPAPADPRPAAPAPAEQTPAPTPIPAAPATSPPNEPAAARRDNAHTPPPSWTPSRRANANIDQAGDDAPSNRWPATQTPRSAPVAPATRPLAYDARAAEQPASPGEPARHTGPATERARGRDRRPASAHEASPRTAEPATAGAASGEQSAHVVRPGECLWTIAERRLGPSATAAKVAALVDELWRLNAARIGTGDPNLIHAGQTLKLP
jgi:hypothetical protein